MKCLVTAEYKVLKSMIVNVDDDADAADPDTWQDIESEQDIDCWLYDVKNVKEAT